MKTTSAAVKLIIFMVTTTLATALLAAALGGISFRDTVSYRAVFEDVSGLLPGDDVRVAGVIVGEVTGVELYQRDKAMVSFTVTDSRPLTVSTQATVRYENLVGERYLELAEGEGSSAELSPGGVIPVKHTQPALDLSVLFNGFKPLFEALSPKKVNKLANEIVTVLQGEAGTINSLLAHTASLTNTLANRDKVIGNVIDNLNAVLETLAERDERLSKLIVQLQRLVSGLADDRNAIGESLEQINTLADTTENLLRDARPSLEADIRELGNLAENLDTHKGMVGNYLERLPEKLNRINRTASYGSWFNFYLCSFDSTVALPTGDLRTPEIKNGTARCKP